MTLASRSLAILAATVGIAAVFFIQVGEARSTPAPTLSRSGATVLGRPDDQIGLFIWGDMPVRQLASEKFAAEAKQGNPLRLFQIAFRLLHEHARKPDPKALRAAERVLDYMLDAYQPTERIGQGVIWHYRHDYDGVKAPWHSGMDQFFAPLTLLAAWEATGNQRYRQAAVASIQLALRSPSEGGSLWRDGRSCWISEYAWRGMNRSEEFHVLNGHLFGLLALAIFNQVAPEPALAAAYDCARRGTLERQATFYREDGKWTWYQTSPKPVINPPHYSLIEISLLRSLRLVTGDAAYIDAENRRIKHFRDYYPVEVSGGRLLLARQGPPHPYMDDIYRPRVKCRSGERSWTMTGRAPVISVKADTDSAECAVSIDTVGYQLPLYTAQTIPTRSEAETLVGELKVDLNAVAVAGDTVTISPSVQAAGQGRSYENDEGRIVIPIGREVGPRDVVAITLRSEKSARLDVLMEDEDAKVGWRSYNDLVAGRELLMLLNPLGFNGPELGKTIRTVTVRIHTDAKAQDFRVRVKSVRIFRSAAQLDAALRGKRTGAHRALH